ncbi:hypothetical protein [Streptomyces sp. NPDC091212]|uniref:hypothetical protein n=1 Tax=Streptomyces sp. NPDC091212 TaxID=3155191 RepID=UPI00343BB45D
MSAWAELVRRATSDEELELLSCALEEVQREQSRRDAAKIQRARETVRAADWGRSSRSKRPYLQGMEAAEKAITKEESV